MTYLRVSPSVERFVAYALKKVPAPQSREQFAKDVVFSYVNELNESSIEFSN